MFEYILFPGNNTPIKKYNNLKKYINFSSVNECENNSDLKDNSDLKKLVFIVHSSGIFDCIHYIYENKFENNTERILCIDTCILDENYFRNNVNNFSKQTIEKYKLFFKKYKDKNLKDLNLILFREIFHYDSKNESKSKMERNIININDTFHYNQIIYYTDYGHYPFTKKGFLNMFKNFIK
jgi:hypothetical protein